jgi:hypothetical protein
MHFAKGACRWLTSVERRLKFASWEEFTKLLLDRFGREQQELLLRQLFNIKQSTFVSNYVERFAELVDQLSTYDHNSIPFILP